MNNMEKEPLRKMSKAKKLKEDKRNNSNSVCNQQEMRSILEKNLNPL